MSKDLIPNEKQILAGIKKECDGIKQHKSALLKFAFALGEKLISAKKQVPHGQWENWINTHEECDFSERQAQKYMMIAAEKKIVSKLFSSIDSVNELCKALSTVTEEQRLEIEAEEEKAKTEKAKTEKAKKVAELEAKKAEEETIKQVQVKEPEIIEGDFQEVKAPSKPVEKPEEVKTGFVQIEAEKMEEIEDSLHELASLNKSISKDNDSMVKIFDANDQLGAAVKEIKRLNDLNTGLEARLNGLMHERNALIKEAKFWRSKAEKLEKVNAK